MRRIDMPKFPRTGSVHTLGPALALLDKCDRLRPYVGQQVRVVQPYGCPRNGTMDQGYVETIDGHFIGLVCRSSLNSKE
jgi:hypothetical protein